MQAILQGVGRHGPRIAVTLLPLIFAVLHAVGLVQLGVLQRLDDIIYDTRLRATMPATRDERVVIVDIDEKSLAEVGRWPWPRSRVADLVDALFDRHQIALLGMDTVFAEPDESSGLPQLERLARELASPRAPLHWPDPRVVYVGMVMVAGKAHAVIGYAEQPAIVGGMIADDDGPALVRLGKGMLQRVDDQLRDDEPQADRDICADLAVIDID